MEGLDQIDGRSYMDDRQVIVETFPALTESRSETERGSQRPDMIGRGMTVRMKRPLDFLTSFAVACPLIDRISPVISTTCTGPLPNPVPNVFQQAQIKLHRKVAHQGLPVPQM